MRATVGGELAAGETIEAALMLRAVEESPEALRREAVHDDPRELVYVPADEWEQFMSRQVEDRWLGPPILGGCPNRPADQLVPRTLGMDILAHRRFSWNNEDLSLWRITGKSIYHDIAVKKAYCLLHAQNEYGGWFEGYEFYNLPPRHHQHYHSYTAFVFLIDLYDVTGHAGFLDAALRSKQFWLGPPPGNSHTVDAPDAWWYRWGGYINDAGYTDERHALNTHASVLMIFSMLWSRTSDAEARTGLDHGVNAFNRALDLGLQRPTGSSSTRSRRSTRGTSSPATRPTSRRSSSRRSRTSTPCCRRSASSSPTGCPATPGWPTPALAPWPTSGPATRAAPRTRTAATR